jgi:NAD(P)-dependent dehydrogenase (short-subunit alcohol dehydrogenase family)
MRLDGSVSLVTGAARRLGKEIALALADRGSHVAVHFGASREPAEETAAQLRRLGVEAIPIGADLRRPMEIDRLFDRVQGQFGRLDLLVNSAASFEHGRFEEIDREEWDNVQALNLRAPFLCLQRGAALMRRSSRPDDAPGAVVNLADLSGLLPWSDQAHHGASKAGLLHLTRLAARDLAPQVRVNAVVPGPILPPPGMSEDDATWRRTAERVPLRRAGEGHEVGDAVVYLATSDFVTGTTLLVDGGEHLLGAGHH